MEIDREETERLEKLVREAFADMPYPAGELIEHDCEECWKLRDDLKGRHWSQLPDDLLIEKCFSTSLLSPEAWHFYLPAFLLLGLRNGDKVDDVENITGDIVIALTVSDEDSDAEEFLRDFMALRWATLSPAQREALCQFLEWYGSLQLRLCVEHWQKHSPGWFQEKLSKGLTPRKILALDSLPPRPESGTIHDIEAIVRLLRGNDEYTVGL
jgi:hypothetical protein